MEISSLNAKITAWLKDERIEEALLGDGKYYIDDSYYRGEHDLLLIVSTIVKWAFFEKRLHYTEEKFVHALEKICKNNVLVGLDAISCYLITIEDLGQQFSIDVSDFIPSIKKGLSNKRKFTANEKKVVVSLLRAISKWIPAYKEIDISLFSQGNIGSGLES